MKEPSIRPFPTVERCAAVIILIFISSSIFLTCNAQVIPGLPDLPSVPPTQSASASSSATPSSSIVLPSPSTSPVPSVTPSNTIGLSQNKPQAPASRLPSSTPSPTSSASPLPEFTPLGLDEKLPDISPQPEKKCERNIELPAPTLGTSQLRYALSVVGSAAFVAFASVVYSAAASWETDRTHELFRLSCVILGRLLIVVAIKISASLVASISNSDPEDGALDASGAFLTWASAILTRAYYEAFQMTLRAIGFFEDKFAWDEQLQEYLSPHYEQLTVAAEEPASSIAGTEARSSVQERQEPKLSIVQRLMGGRWDRRLLIAHAFIYIGTEIATLVINLKDFVNSFSHPNERTIFVSSEFAGQCGIMEEDAPGKYLYPDVLYDRRYYDSSIFLILTTCDHEFCIFRSFIRIVNNSSAFSAISATIASAFADYCCRRNR